VADGLARELEDQWHILANVSAVSLTLFDFGAE